MHPLIMTIYNKFTKIKKTKELQIFLLHHKPYQ